jgi:hypothetical protein
MKIAYTMNGLIGSISGKNYEEKDANFTKEIAKYTYKFLDEHILKNNDVDIFLFSWHDTDKDILDEIYKPVKSLHTPQVVFVDLPNHLTQKEWAYDRVQAHISKWYGFKEVMRLRQEYEKENNIKYDLVVNARFDHCWINDMDFSNFDVDKVHLSNFIDRKYGWPTDISNQELLADIFVMKPEYIDKFATMFDNLGEYTLPGQCTQWKFISHHFLTPWHLRKLGLLSEDLIEFSLKTYFPPRFQMEYPLINNRDWTESSHMILRHKMEMDNLSREDILEVVNNEE